MKKLLAFILAMLMALAVFAGCAAEPQNTAPAASATAEGTAEPSAEETSAASAGTQWLNSDVSGNVTADMETDVKDDFHAAVNQEWMVGTELGARAEVSSFTERGNEVMEEILALLQDESQTSHEAQLVQELYRDFTDMERRNELGMEPILPYVEEIQSIETLDDLTAFFTENKEQLAGVPLSITILADWKDSTHNAIYLDPPTFSLSDADEYKSMTNVGERTKAAVETMFQKLLVRVGYTEEEAASLCEQFLALETEMASAAMGETESNAEDFQEKAYNPVSAAELAELSPNFPIVDMLKEFTDAGIDRFILTEPDWLAKMNELYTEENVEAFQAWLLYKTLNGTAAMLDQECLDILTEYSAAVSGNAQTEISVEELAYQICSQMLDMAIGRMYVENYVSEETKQNVTEMVDQIVGVFRQRLEQNEWLGDETKARAIEKLDNLKIRVAYPDDWSLYDYSDYIFPEDGGILDDILVIREKAREQRVEQARTEIDSNVWSISPQTVNAFYSPSDNSINIPAGILGGDFYDAESSIEEQMGALGVIVGHEITHGFDSNMGSLYDKDGNLSNWWTEEDRAAFKERTDKVAAYYASKEVLPGQYVNGEYTIGETVADLGGMSCLLEIARGMEDFDYQAFFTSWARVWKLQETEAVAETLLQTDVHAPHYLRTNVNVQQFQEFYDAFGVEEGDGMYLAPEERLSVW